MREMAHALVAAKNDERMVMLALRLALMFGHAESVLGVPMIERYRFEVNLGIGRADLVLFHRDESITIVEAKADSEVRNVVAGIGQLCLYEAAIPEAMKGRARKPTYVRKVLASPLNPEKSVFVMSACAIAGVQYAHLGCYKDLQQALVNRGWVNGA